MNRIKIGKGCGWTFLILMSIFTILYALYAFSLLIFGSGYRAFSVGWSPFSHNFIPFKTIGFYLFNPDSFDRGIVFNNIIGNILVFMPLGFFVSFFSAKMRKTTRILILTFTVSTLVEAIQGILHVGSVDIDDVILNTLGGLIGFMCLLIDLKVFSFFFEWDFHNKKAHREL